MRSRWAGFALLPLLSACPTEYAPELNIPTGSVEIYDEEAYVLLQDDVRPVIRARNFEWTEGPLWIEDGGYVLFSDIPQNFVYQYKPGVGTKLYLDNAGATGLVEGDYVQGSNGLLLDKRGRLVLMQHGDRRVAVMRASVDSPQADYQTLADRFEDKRLNSPNDGAIHSDGSLFFTDPPYGLAGLLDDERKELPFQGIYRLHPDGTLDLLDDSVSYPNGIGLSPDEKTLYVAVSDHDDAVWLAYDVNTDGSVSNKRVFYDANEMLGKEGEYGYPDGMAVHSNGVIFATGPGGVWMFSPEGTPLARILTGRATSNCALSNDESTLYITADDTLMGLRLGEIS